MSDIKEIDETVDLRGRPKFMEDARMRGFICPDLLWAQVKEKVSKSEGVNISSYIRNLIIEDLKK